MEKIQIFLGLNGDNRVYNSSNAIPGAYAGLINVGPGKFLQFLELHLGLSGVFPTGQQRVLKLKEGLDSIKTDEAFLFLQSYENDPLGVAKRLLKLWDTWRMSGWDVENTHNLPERMKMMLHFSHIFLNAGPAEPDRICAVLESLQQKIALPSFSLTVLDDLTLFPELYQQLLNKLQEHILLPPIDKSVELVTDLDKLKAVLSGKKLSADQKKLTNDGSLQLLHFNDDIQAASAIFSIQQKKRWNPLVVGPDHGLLNGLSLRLGKPVCDWQLSGGNGQILQLFFLATAMFKRPMQATEVIAFLSAPHLPFSKTLARKLVEIFAAKPGVHNSDWLDAIAAYKETIKHEDYAPQQTEVIAFWLQSSMELKEGNYAITVLKDIYHTLSKWAMKRSHSPSTDAISQLQLLQLASLCNDLIAALGADGLSVSDAKLDRLQSQLYSDSVYSIRDAEVGCSNAISEPSNVWTSSEETLWMNAIRSEVSASSAAWYTEEKNFLRGNGYAVLDNSSEYRNQQEGIKRMILNTSKRLVLVIPSMFHGAKAYSPFCIDEWREKLEMSAVTIQYNDLMQHVPWMHDISLTAVYPPIQLPQPKTYVSIPSADYTREKESYTSIEKMIQHPLQWFFDYQLYLSYKGGTSFPEEATLRGTIADAVVQALFTPANTFESWWLEAAAFEQMVATTLDETLQQQGVLFLEDGFKRSLIEYRKKLSQHLVNLKEMITSNGFEIAGTQVLCNGLVNGQEVKGSIDLLLKKSNHYFIIDLKWAFSTKSYEKRIKEGTDLQLALYEKLYPGANASAYFLLNDGKLLLRNNSTNVSGRSVFGIEANEGVSAANTIRAAEKATVFRKGEMKEGKLEAAYQLPLEELQPAYYEKQEAENLYPLQEADDGFKKFPYTGDLNLILGQIH